MPARSKLRCWGFPLRGWWLVGLVGCGGAPQAPEATPLPWTVDIPRGGTAHGRPPGRVGDAVRPNLVVVVLDEVGIGRLDLYGGPAGVATPSLAALADGGVRFERAWSHPTCSPTRAAMMTGRQPFRYGIGTHLLDDEAHELPLDERTLAEALGPYGYTSVALGKWHLAGGTAPSGLDHPLLQGFAHHWGSFTNLSAAGTAQRYFDWWKVMDGGEVRRRVYATTDTTNDAIAFADGLPEPWFLWVAYNAAHSPAHVPPASLLPSPVAAGAPDHELHAAMLTALDKELGRLIDALDDDTWVVVVGDNGVGEWGLPPDVPGLGPDRVKRSPYEGGVRVPLLVRGPGAAQGAAAEAIVADVDVFPTLLDLAGVPAWDDAWKGLDGVSFAHVLNDPEAPALRSHVVSEHREPNGLVPPDVWTGMVTDGRYKLVGGLDGPVELYDLDVAWPEGEDLLATGAPGAVAVRNRLGAAWWAAHGDP